MAEVVALVAEEATQPNAVPQGRPVKEGASATDPRIESLSREVERLRREVERRKEISRRQNKYTDDLRRKIQDMHRYTPAGRAEAEICRLAGLGEEFLARAHPQVEAAYARALTLSAKGASVETIVAEVGLPVLLLAGIMPDEPAAVVDRLDVAAGRMLVAMMRARRGDYDFHPLGDGEEEGPR
jgi:hypothetical protein